MNPLVLITYLVLVMAVVGQAVHVQDGATGKAAELQVRDVPTASDGEHDPTLDRTERTERAHEIDKVRTESERGDSI